MDTLILGIETSCDETSVAIVRNGKHILSNIISSQIDTHQKFGGVVPELASRKHLENVIPVIEEALREAGVSLREIAAVGVTYGPGLVGALLVGVSAAKAIAYAQGIPLIGVHHIESHMYANFLEHENLTFPFICLTVSGGHTTLVCLREHGRFELLGQTRDDAAGEAFDKVARLLGLGYPGGPFIDVLAQSGDAHAINFPQAFRSEDSCEFSFSGLKSAVINYLHNQQQRDEAVNKANVAASFQFAIVDTLAFKAVCAAQKLGISKIALAGGVAANTSLRNVIRERAKGQGLEILYPSPVLCTDNAAMVACRAYYQYLVQDFASLSLNASPLLPLGLCIRV
jgi:N6-L-threonylcarbamoyladenine synthase